MELKSLQNAALIFVSVCFAASAVAEETINVELQDEVEREGDVVKIKSNDYAAPSQKIIIVEGSNVQSSNQNQTQQQPTTFVEASPLTESRADRIRRKRKEAEVGTEQQIVEKLEESRLSDEKDRADRLFGDRLDKKEPATIQQVPVYEQPIVVPVQPVQADETKGVDSDAKEEILAAVNELKVDQEKVKVADKKDSKFYISGSVGAANYTDTDNIQENEALGFALGTDDGQVSIEASFLYSNYYIDEYWKFNYFKEMDQYNFAIAGKYSLIQGRIRPQVGGIASYTHRKYADRSYYSYNLPADNEIESDAFDLGLIGGIEVQVTDSFSVGAHATYMMNIMNNNDSPFFDRNSFSEPENVEPLEEISYYFMTVSGKMTF